MPEEGKINRTFLTWDVVFKIASLVILIFSGLSVEQVGRAVTRVQTQTEAAKDAATKADERTRHIVQTVSDTNRKVAVQEAIVQEQTVLTAQQAEFLTLLTTRFNDVAQRQQTILGTIAELAQMHKELLGHHHNFMGIAESVHQDMEQLVQMLTALRQEVQALKPPPAPAPDRPRP